jgi:hypothetical protein
VEFVIIYVQPQHLNFVLSLVLFQTLKKAMAALADWEPTRKPTYCNNQWQSRIPYITLFEAKNKRKRQSTVATSPGLSL